MSEVKPNASFEDRRKLMKKVKNLVEQAEAAARRNTTSTSASGGDIDGTAGSEYLNDMDANIDADVDLGVHVSDVSSAEDSDEEQEDAPEDERKKDSTLRNSDGTKTKEQIDYLFHERYYRNADTDADANADADAQVKAFTSPTSTSFQGSSPPFKSNLSNSISKGNTSYTPSPNTNLNSNINPNIYSQHRQDSNRQGTSTPILSNPPMGDFHPTTTTTSTAYTASDILNSPTYLRRSENLATGSTIGGSGGTPGSASRSIGMKSPLSSTYPTNTTTSAMNATGNVTTTAAAAATNSAPRTTSRPPRPSASAAHSSTPQDRIGGGVGGMHGSYDLPTPSSTTMHGVHAATGIPFTSNLTGTGTGAGAAGKSSASVMSSKVSIGTHGTPYNYGYMGKPVLSPPFTFLSPPGSSSRLSGASGTDGAGESGNSGTKSGRSRVPPHPIDVVTSARATPPKTKEEDTNIRTHTGGGNENDMTALNQMKQDIDSLTKQFEELHANSLRGKYAAASTPKGNDTAGTPTAPQDQSYPNDDLATQQQAQQHRKDHAEEYFTQDLNIMGKKADLMLDALKRNIGFMDKLQQENDVLKNYIRHVASTGHEYGGTDAAAHVHTYTPQQQSQSHTPLSEPKASELDPSDEYVQRRYPYVPKTPGTMFTTEFVEHTELNVGDHAYLADLLDRQWNTTNEYYPSRR